MSLNVLTKHFELIEDPRQKIKVIYPLHDVLFLTVAAIIAGCEGWEDIEDFGHCKLEWLRQYAPFKHATPVHDTIARLVSRVNPDALHKCFVQWMKETETLTDNQVIAIDGKTLRRSYDPSDRKSTIHMVSAFASQNGVVMGQLKTDAKSNEITAIPELLDLLELKGHLVTLDAMGCQTKIAKKIIEKEANYLFSVKGNQGSLHQAIKEAFYTDSQNERAAAYSYLEQQRGRTEYRKYDVLPAAPFHLTEKWSKLTTIGKAIYYRIENGKELIDTRYYISSAQLSAEELANHVRSHWAVENQLHWVLDVSFREDNCPINRGHAAENFSTFRHVGLNQLKRESTLKASVRRKQRRAAMDTEYLDKVIRA
ncbi:hypothetical protein BGP78_11960 [Pseudoalteromonas sp. MSK9-3]|nr:ISAs1 family transposase [Pseudoalteromonas sp. MSK9-3]RJE76696.1 hypothetical protein BGP78_11960 [Pseudoalteromonas sp. MSK9-3]